MITDIEDIIFPITFVIVIGSIIKCTHPNACDAIADCHACKSAAIIKCSFPNACDAVGNRDASQVVVTLERLIGYCLCTVSNAVCVRKRKRWICHDQMIVDIKYAVFPVAFIIRICGVVERSCIDACNVVRYGDACKALTNHERVPPNTCDVVGNRDAFQADAILKRPLSNACDAVGDRYIFQTGAILERIITNPCDAVGNCHFC